MLPARPGGTFPAMGLAAFVLPERWVAATPLPGLDPAALGALRAERAALAEQLRRERPAEGTEGEQAVLYRLVRFGLSVRRALGPAFVEVLRSGVDAGLSELLAKELAAAETARKLALRRIEQALHTFGVLVESIGAVFTELPAPSVAPLLDEAARRFEHGEVSLDAEERALLRFELDLLMAFESLDEPLSELTYWAYRVAVSARRVEAMPSPKIPAALRGELARLRARVSWQSWDAEEIQKEFAPWPRVDRLP
jgi:hypothetical protein